MAFTKLNDIFSGSELEEINQTINEYLSIDEYISSKEYQINQPDFQVGTDTNLGRLQIDLKMPKAIEDKLTIICSSILGFSVRMTTVLCVEYNNKYGNPNLSPHFDHDRNNLVVDYQLESNTSWDLGIDLSTHSLEDNSALIFNGNEHIHWRPHKTFKDGEHIKMIFFRFSYARDNAKYIHPDYHPDDPIYDEVKRFRDSLGN